MSVTMRMVTASKSKLSPTVNHSNVMPFSRIVISSRICCRSFPSGRGTGFMEGVACIYGTYGGIYADDASRVLNENDEVIPGLYAATEQFRSCLIISGA